MKPNKKDKALNAIIAMFLLALVSSSFASAVTISYETSSVSRIVGDSPEDLINQLDAVEQELNHASYYGQEPWTSFDSYDTKKKSIEHMFDEYTVDNNWDFDEINTNAFEQQELFIIEAEGDADLNSYETTWSNSQIDPNDVSPWIDDFARTYPIFIFDSDYAGLHIPGEESYINELTRYGQIIAPTFFNSREFTTSFVCNLGDGKTLGNSFREARNKYYENTNPSNKELIGITLMSYHLYGNPLATIQTPNYDKSRMKDICEELLGKKEDNPFSGNGFSAQDYNNKISKIIVNNYNIINVDGFDLLNSSNGRNQLVNYELLKPLIVESHEFPKNTIITNITYHFQNPENIVLNLPEYQDGLANRSCYFDEENESFEYEVQYTENNQNLKLYILPLKVNNCTTGEFTYYRSVSYDIDYISKSPMKFEIEHPNKILPNADTNINITINYVNNETIDGLIQLIKENTTIYETEITSNIHEIAIPIKSENKETMTRYFLRYISNDGILNENVFEIETRLLEYYIDVPKTVSGTASIDLNVINYGKSTIPLTVKDNLILDKDIIQDSKNIYDINPGINSISFSYSNLLRSAQRYTLLFDLDYGYHGSLVDEIITNHPPVIDSIPTQNIRAGDLYTLNYSYYDLDNDPITISISQPLDNYATWQTTPSDEGEHIINITASDGLATTVKSFRLIVDPYNREPILDQITNRTVQYNTTLPIYLYAYDEDGDNLTYFVEHPDFVNITRTWFEWMPSYDDIGNHTIFYGVDDGRSTVRNSFNVNIVSNITLPPINTTGLVFRNITSFVGGSASLDFTQAERKTLTIRIRKDVNISHARFTVSQPDGVVGGGSDEGQGGWSS